jgi:hypothetical protein
MLLSRWNGASFSMTGTEPLSLPYFAPLRGEPRQSVYSSDSGSAPVMLLCDF